MIPFLENASLLKTLGVSPSRDGDSPSDQSVLIPSFLQFFLTCATSVQTLIPGLWRKAEAEAKLCILQFNILVAT